MPRRQKTSGLREWVIAALLVVARALCWISWRVGSPLLSGIRDVEDREAVEEPPSAIGHAVTQDAVTNFLWMIYRCGWATK